MKELTNEELKAIEGGFELEIGTLALITLGIPFVAGVLDGFIRPLSCN